MIFQILTALFLLLIYFTVYFKFGSLVAKITGRRVCPVCYAVGSTWLTLLLLKISGLLIVNKYLIAMLLAESVVGVSYVIEEFLVWHPMKIDVNEYVLKFGLILYGSFTVFVFAFVQELAGILLFAPVVCFGFYAFTPIKRSNRG